MERLKNNDSRWKNGGGKYPHKKEVMNWAAKWKIRWLCVNFQTIRGNIWVRKKDYKSGVSFVVSPKLNTLRCTSCNFFLLDSTLFCPLFEWLRLKLNKETSILNYNLLWFCCSFVWSRLLAVCGTLFTSRDISSKSKWNAIEKGRKKYQSNGNFNSVLQTWVVVHTKIVYHVTLFYAHSFIHTQTHTAPDSFLSSSSSSSARVFHLNRLSSLEIFLNR